MRPIDADRMKEELLWGNAFLSAKEINALVDLIDNQPTLTPPNEPLTCEGCACEEYRRDTYPCNCCARNDETISDQYRPPEGEADE